MKIPKETQKKDDSDAYNDWCHGEDCWLEQEARMELVVCCDERSTEGVQILGLLCLLLLLFFFALTIAQTVYSAGQFYQILSPTNNSPPILPVTPRPRHL
ncbi:unnamed protein product [Vicia faba]|uniref:Uncharacterized protein n=1 Tax=Vicia faba TaxID=3906 RepID=A0AAV0YEC3_VICFA|nr:unnamed protein product [Vicia faba]